MTGASRPSRAAVDALAADASRRLIAVRAWQALRDDAVDALADALLGIVDTPPSGQPGDIERRRQQVDELFAAFAERFPEVGQ